MRTWHLEKPDIAPLLPAIAFGRLQISAPAFCRLQFSNRSWNFETAFHSPTETVRLREHPSAGSNAPGLFLQFTAESGVEFVRSQAPLLAAIAGYGAVSSPETRFPTPGLNNLEQMATRHSPPGLLGLRDQSTQIVFNPSRLPWYYARSPFAPRQQSTVFNQLAVGSSFPVRYVSPDLLFL